MAEVVSSAIVQETVSQVLSGLVQKYEEKEESNVNRNLERLEMAHIRLEAALETSERWQITDVSLLCWRRKLKRAAQECDETLHRCKLKILEDNHMEHTCLPLAAPKQIQTHRNLTNRTMTQFEATAQGSGTTHRIVAHDRIKDITKTSEL
jgi:hypothetical protein